MSKVVEFSGKKKNTATNKPSGKKHNKEAIKTEYKKLLHDLESKNSLDNKKVLKLLDTIFEDSPYSFKNENLLPIYNNICLANFLILPNATVKIRFKGHEENWVQITVIHESGEKQALLLSADQISSNRWVHRNLGLKFRVAIDKYAYEHIKNILLILCDYAPSVEKPAYLGWVDIDKGIYCFGDKMAGNTGDLPYVYPHESIEKYNLEIDYDIGRKQACRFVLNDMLNVSIPSKTRIFVSYALLSLMYSILIKTDGEAPQFVLLILGRTGCRKTTISKLFFNIYNKDRVHITFSSTTAAFDLLFQLYGDTTMIFDDLKPPASRLERKDLQLKIERILRVFGDAGAGRQKVVGFKKVEHQPEGMAVVTAEDMPLEANSSLARFFHVELGVASVNLEKLTEAQSNRECWTTFIYQYICHIAENGCMDYADRLRTKFRTARNRYLESYPDAHPRVCEAAAWLNASYQEFIEYAELNKAISNKQAEAQRNEMENDLGQYIARSEQLTDNADEVTMFIKGVHSLLLAKEASIPQARIHKKKVTIDSTPNTIGFEDSKYVYLFTEIAYSKVVSYYSRMRKEFPVSEKVLRTMLFQRKLLEPNDCKDGTLTVRPTVNGIRHGAIKIKKENFYKYDEGGKKNEKQSDAIERAKDKITKGEE